MPNDLSSPTAPQPCAIRLGFWIAFIAAAVSQTACAGFQGGRATALEEEKQIVRIDPRFSFNVAKVPDWFPGDDEQLTDTEKIVLLTKGKPDYFRFWRDDAGLFPKNSTFWDHMIKEIDRSWIYLEEGVEVHFLKQGGYIEEDIGDKTRVVCEFGDPSYRSGSRFARDGEVKEYWRWAGRKGPWIWIDFINGEEVNRRSFGTGIMAM